MDRRHAHQTREGYCYALAAYGMWGLVPLYFKALQSVPPLEVLAHRIVWSVFFLAALLTWFRTWPVLVGCLRQPRKVAGFLVTALLIAANWYGFIYGVEVNEVKQASLGYYITPLVSVALGVTLLRESLRRLQVVALLLAGAGVAVLIWRMGQVPWISLTLAGSFGLYGLIRKQLRVDGLVGLSLETIFLTPLALAYLGLLHGQGTLSLAQGDSGRDMLLVASGIVTALPLMCFGQAAQRLPLTALGFLQYLSPTIQMVLALSVFGEETLPLEGLIMVWIALLVFTLESLYQAKRASAATV
jgi:chloramphenicol-sensitive protein RarD